MQMQVQIREKCDCFLVIRAPKARGSRETQKRKRDPRPHSAISWVFNSPGEAFFILFQLDFDCFPESDGNKSVSARLICACDNLLRRRSNARKLFTVAEITSFNSVNKNKHSLL